MRCSRPLLPARGLSSFFVVKPGSHPYVLHPPHPPVHTKLCQEQTDAYPPRRAPATIAANPPVPNPGGCARPRATSIRRALHKGPSQHCQRTTPTPLSSVHRAPAMPAHTRTRTLLSLTRDRYIHTNYKLTRFRTCAGSTFDLGEKEAAAREATR